jgi:hypothetical protein
MFSIGLDWQRDAEGYRRADMGRHGQSIVRNGGKWISTQPLVKGDMLYAEFAGIKTAEQVLNFVNRYGFLISAFGRFGGAIDPVTLKLRDEGYEGELVDEHLKNARLVRLIMKAENAGRKSLSSKDSLALSGILDREVQGEFSLAPDRERGFRFVFQATSLMNAIWIQLAQKVSGGIKFQACRHCGAWFEVGAGTGKRADSDFCKTSHRVAFNRKLHCKGA